MKMLTGNRPKADKCEEKSTQKSKNQTRIKDSLDIAEQNEVISDWVKVDVKKMEGVFKSVPERIDLPSDINESLVVELYSK